MYIATKIIGIPQKQSDSYTLRYVDNKSIMNISEAQISPSNPITTPNNTLKFQDTTLPIWIKQNATATIFTLDIKRPV